MKAFLPPLMRALPPRDLHQDLNYIQLYAEPGFEAGRERVGVWSITIAEEPYDSGDGQMVRIRSKDPCACVHSFDLAEVVGKTGTEENLRRIFLDMPDMRVLAAALQLQGVPVFCAIIGVQYKFALERLAWMRAERKKQFSTAYLRHNVCPTNEKIPAAA